MSFSKIMHSIGDALSVLKGATPLIGSDSAKVDAIIDDVHTLANTIEQGVSDVHTATTGEGVKVDPNALRTTLVELLPGFLEEGVSFALQKLLPQHVQAVVTAAVPEVKAAVAASSAPAAE